MKDEQSLKVGKERLVILKPPDEALRHLSHGDGQAEEAIHHRRRRNLKDGELAALGMHSAMHVASSLLSARRADPAGIADQAQEGGSLEVGPLLVLDRLGCFEQGLPFLGGGNRALFAGFFLMICPGWQPRGKRFKTGERSRAAQASVNQRRVPGPVQGLDEVGVEDAKPGRARLIPGLVGFFEGHERVRVKAEKIRRRLARVRQAKRQFAQSAGKREFVEIFPDALEGVADLGAVDPAHLRPRLFDEGPDRGHERLQRPAEPPGADGIPGHPSDPAVLLRQRRDDAVAFFVGDGPEGDCKGAGWLHF